MAVEDFATFHLCDSNLHLTVPAFKVGEGGIRAVSKASEECSYHEPCLLRWSHSSKSGPSSLENSSNKQSDRAVLDGANSTSTHGLCGGDIVHVLLDQTHCCLLEPRCWEERLDGREGGREGRRIREVE